ncbi:capsular biosynthesis protein [Vibrio chagasii]|uniref:capsular biosynthesis protein n=1 Tax=Vibrio chagasii TaxID=170679 RepID=UPI003DA0B2F5
MLIIMSGAYIGSELQSEFGCLPPSFLPLANRRLFVKQAELARKDEKIYLTLPRSYDLKRHDIECLQNHNIGVLKVSDSASIGESLSQALILAKPNENEKLKVLFGDTLIDSFADSANTIGVASIRDDYGWAKLSDVLSGCDQFSDNQVFSGHFSVSSPSKLLQNLAKHDFELFAALNEYHVEETFHIDDSKVWLDFGHVNTYYSSRAKYTTQRSFNDLTITIEKVKKSSGQTFKMHGEINWFQNIPPDLNIFTPQFLGSFSVPNIGYELEYLYSTPLNELFVFSSLSNNTWKKIIASCFHFLDKCKSYTFDEENYELGEFFENKTFSRLNEYFEREESSLDTMWVFNDYAPISIREILRDIARYTPSVSQKNIMHGDFCFSNILYDFKTNRIKVIDPRGVDLSGDSTIFGSQLYDIAKLSHSLIGSYDMILARSFLLEFEIGKISFEIIEGYEHSSLQEWFYQECLIRFGVCRNQILSMQIHLFLSMLPLHSDDIIRQRALLSNVFRLYYKLRK